MTIVHTPYDALATRSMARIKEIRSNLNEAIARDLVREVGQLTTQDGQLGKVYRMVGGDILSDSTPFFSHPFNLEDDRGVHRMVFDARQFGRVSGQEANYVVRNQPEYDWSMQRAILSLRWHMGEHKRLQAQSALPQQVYANMIAESLSRRYVLDPRETLVVGALSGLYYACLHSDEPLSEVERVQFVGKMARALRCPSEFVMEVTEDVEKIDSLNSLCEEIKKKTGDRMESLEPALVIAVCASNWFGTNSREVMAVALEHVPTWMMIVFACLGEATFKRTPVAKVVERAAKNHNPDSYKRSLEILLRLEGDGSDLPF